jgi:phenylpropionate dioxygenase-like ring-hydroxylating dioxygenase large terminal subunit
VGGRWTFVVRKRDHVLRAVYNACRHRAPQLPDPLHEL